MAATVDSELQRLVQGHLQKRLSDVGITAVVDVRNACGGMTGRVRIVSDDFQGKSVEEREQIVEPLIGELPDEVAARIVMLMLATNNQLMGVDDDDYQIRYLNQCFEEQDTES